MTAKMEPGKMRMIPIDQIDVLNPRERNKGVFDEIVGNIKAIGLKKPITVTPRTGPDGTERYTPSVNHLFAAAGRAGGSDVLAVVLTGMGDDGAAGSKIVHEHGGRVLVESEETAVIFGMPRSTIETGIPVQQRPLHMVADHITLFTR